MWALGNLIGNVMNAGVANTVPVKLGKFQFPPEHEEKREQNLILAVQMQNGSGNFFEIGRSSVIEVKDNEHDIDKTLQIPYHFTEMQRLKFVAYTIPDDDDTDPEEAGVAITSVALIVSTRSMEMEFSNNVGRLQVDTERIDDYRSITMNVGAEKLEKKDLFGKCDPYLEISRKEGGGSWAVIHRTEHLKDTHSPQWNEFVLPYNLLCGNDADDDVKFACYDFNKGGSDFIGETLISPAQILKMSSSQSFALMNSKKKHKKKGLGRLTIRKCKVKREPSFISYLLNGCNLHLTTAIDFTGSNGSPQENTSLHYNGSTNPNAYVVSLRATGRILQEYTKDKQISAYGYGAKIPPNNTVSHDFNLDLETDNPICRGLEDLIPKYCKTLSAVKLWGPTNFAPIINKVISAAEKSEMDYHILLILTDGVVTDLEETKEATVRASKLPISIIIVGIGNAEFSAMDIFNKGTKAIKSATGESMSRDITKFIIFRKADLSSLDTLGKGLLGELPAQVVEYFRTNEIDLSSTPKTIQEKSDGTVENGEIVNTNGILRSSKRKAPDPPSRNVTPDEEENPAMPNLKNEDSVSEISAL